MKKIAVLAALLMVFACGSAWADTTGDPSVGVNFVGDGPYNASPGDGAYDCDAWVNTTANPNFTQWWNGLADDHANGSINLGYGRPGAQSAWNGGDPSRPLSLLKGMAKVHYYGQEWFGTNMSSAGYSSYDIYIYGFASTATLDATCTNGQTQSATGPMNGAAYVQGTNYMLWTGVTADAWHITGGESDSCAFQVVGHLPPPPPVAEPAGLGLIGLALLAVRKRRS